MLKTGVFAAVALMSGSALAQVVPPNFAPNPSVGWYNYGRQYMPPASGPGPVQQDAERPYVTNDEFRVSGRQPTEQLADRHHARTHRGIAQFKCQPLDFLGDRFYLDIVAGGCDLLEPRLGDYQFADAIHKFVQACGWDANAASIGGRVCFPRPYRR